MSSRILLSKKGRRALQHQFYNQYFNNTMRVPTIVWCRKRREAGGKRAFVQKQRKSGALEWTCWTEQSCQNMS